MKKIVKTINASDFKAKCLSILDHLEPSGLLILKRGKGVARIVPVASKTALELAGSLKGKIRIKGDIFSTGTKWNAQS